MPQYRTFRTARRLEFVGETEHYRIYRKPTDGGLVYRNLTFPFATYQVDWYDIDLQQMWLDHANLGRDGFVEFLRAILTQPIYASQVEWCVRCSALTLEDNGSTTIDNDFACRSCIEDHYVTCYRCGVLAQFGHLVETLEETQVCTPCRDVAYSYCEFDDGWYRDGLDDHSHGNGGHGGCCVSPALAFSIRNDGEEPLVAGQRATITLPAGVIDAAGLQRIWNHVYGQGMHEECGIVNQLGDRWQTKEGNFTKRFSRAVYKAFGRKVPPDVLSMIGTIAGEHSRSVDFEIMITRDLNQNARYFYHSDSCWWQSYATSRCVVKTNGGFGLLSYDEYGNTSGRAWVMPLKTNAYPGYPTGHPYGLVPTFNAMTPDAFVVFNGYGALEGYNAARIIAHMAGMTYRKVEFAADDVFVNSGGYLVAAEDIATAYTDRSLHVSVQSHSNLFQIESEAALAEKEMLTHVA